MVQILEQDNYKVALGLAREAFALLDPEAQALRCGGTIVADPPSIEVPYFDLRCIVSHPGGAVRVEGSPEPLREWEHILLLHYLTSTAPVPLEREPIPFSGVPSGAFYDAAFQRRVKNHFLSMFAAKPHLLAPAAVKLGGQAVPGSGDITVRIAAFPRVLLTFTLWRADDEFPADMQLLLSSSIAAYLSTEDIAVLGGIAVGKLMAGARAVDR
jgi:hypothetical protein